MVINSQNRPKILFVDHSAVLGGGELSLFDIVTAYSDNCEVLLFADGPFREKLEAAQIRVRIATVPETVLNLRSSGGLEALTSISGLNAIASQIVQIAKAFDVIHANSQKAFIVCAIARLRGSPPVVWHLRDMLTAKHFSPINRYIVTILANLCAARVLVNSHATGEAFIKVGGRKSLVRLVYNGIDAQAFRQVTPEQIQEIRQQLSIGDIPLIGSFSRLSFWKGQHILLEAIREIPGVHILLVGSALFGEEDYVASLKKLSDSPELVGRVHWLGFRHDIPLLMKACDLVVHTSTEPEPFGRVIIEGQLAQKPVIATAAGGAIELIEDGVTGSLTPPGDVIALRAKILALLQDKTKAEQIAKQGCDRARVAFCVPTMLENFETAISNL
jgi:glycosyltransferase involved in cell wall biosynthesis